MSALLNEQIALSALAQVAPIAIRPEIEALRQTHLHALGTIVDTLVVETGSPELVITRLLENNTTTIPLTLLSAEVVSQLESVVGDSSLSVLDQTQTALVTHVSNQLEVLDAERTLPYLLAYASRVPGSFISRLQVLEELSEITKQPAVVALVQGLQDVTLVQIERQLRALPSLPDKVQYLSVLATGELDELRTFLHLDSVLGSRPSELDAVLLGAKEQIDREILSQILLPVEGKTDRLLSHLQETPRGLDLAVVRKLHELAEHNTLPVNRLEEVQDLYKETIQAFVARASRNPALLNPTPQTQYILAAIVEENPVGLGQQLENIRQRNLRNVQEYVQTSVVDSLTQQQYQAQLDQVQQLTGEVVNVVMPQSPALPAQVPQEAIQTVTSTVDSASSVVENSAHSVVQPIVNEVVPSVTGTLPLLPVVNTLVPTLLPNLR